MTSNWLEHFLFTFSMSTRRDKKSPQKSGAAFYPSGFLICLTYPMPTCLQPCSHTGPLLSPSSFFENAAKEAWFRLDSGEKIVTGTDKPDKLTSKTSKQPASCNLVGGHRRFHHHRLSHQWDEMIYILTFPERLGDADNMGHGHYVHGMYRSASSGSDLRTLQNVYCMCVPLRRGQNRW